MNINDLNITDIYTKMQYFQRFNKIVLNIILFTVSLNQRQFLTCLSFFTG